MLLGSLSWCEDSGNDCLIHRNDGVVGVVWPALPVQYEASDGMPIWWREEIHFWNNSYMHEFVNINEQQQLQSTTTTTTTSTTTTTTPTVIENQEQQPTTTANNDNNQQQQQ